MTQSEALNKYFGYKNFRTGQEEIINSVIEGKNVLAILPTGAGKSMCYQIPSLISENFSIVISPLIALMKDQVDALNSREKIAAFINSTMSFNEAEQVLGEIFLGNIKMLYIAPERLENLQFADRLKSMNPSFLFIDEAHCISEWGHSFRPSYRKIKEFIDYTGIKNISAFTATATPEVVKDIVKQLGFKEPKIFVKGFERSNLSLNVLINKKKKETCLELILNNELPGIIYCASRKNTKEVSDYLNMKGIKCTYYHAGVAPEERRKIQEEFIEGKYKIITATNAFGMGVDKKDIRLIIHYNIPGSIENYYQEIGRAGRDGKLSNVFLLYDEPDIQIQQYFLKNSHPDKELIKAVYDGVSEYSKIPVDFLPENPVPVNQEYLSAFAKKKVNRALVYSSLKILEDGGYLKILSEFDNKETLKINFDKNQLKKFLQNTSNNNLKEVILLILREYGSEPFLNRHPVSLVKLAANHELDENEIKESLIILDSIGVLDYNRTLAKDSVRFLQPRIESRYLRLNYKKINEQYINLQNKINLMVDYALTKECKFKFILNYFGENVDNYRCGKCDNCTINEKLPDTSAIYLKEIILRSLSEVTINFNQKKLIEYLSGKNSGNYDIHAESFGSAANYNANDIKMIISELSQSKHIVKDTVSNKLSLTEKGKGFLEVQGFKVKSEEGPHYEEDLELFNLLREARKKAAKKFMQTGYLICPDEVLRIVAHKKPKTEWELKSVDGFNQRMFNKVGEDFIEIINDFFANKKDTNANKKIARTLPANIMETYNLLKKGYNLKDIASLRKVSDAIISMQIETIIEFYPDVELKNLFENRELELINKEIVKGYENLKDLKLKLPSEITYAQIRIAVAKHKFSSSDSLNYQRKQ